MATSTFEIAIFIFDTNTVHFVIIVWQLLRGLV